MYKLLVADDEKWVRKGIVSKLDQLGFSFSEILEAANGEDAFEMIKQHHPNIVITDIKMPLMDGIALIKNTVEIYPDIKFVIISGYTEFEYAEQALNMGVSGYLLKPIGDENVDKVLHKVIANLDHVSEIELLKQEKETQDENNDFLVLERQINQIFHILGNNSADKQKPYAEIFSEEMCMLILLHIDNVNYYRSCFKYNDLGLIKFSIKNILNEIANHENVVVMDNFKDVTQVMVLVHHPQSETLKSICDRFVIEAYTKIQKSLQLHITVAVSGIEKGVTGELYRQACAAFDLRLSHGGNQIYRYQKLESKSFDFSEHKLRLLQNCLSLYDFKNANIILKDILSPERLKESPGVYVHFLYSEIVTMLVKVCGQLGIDIEKTMSMDMLSGDILNSFDTADEIANYFYTTIVDIMGAESMVVQNCKDLIGRVKSYASQNYSQELMVTDLAQKFAVNPNYLSTIFKQSTGETITKYIERIRIEKSCQLLLSSKNSISDIAQSVGYHDAQYFYRVFRKTMGITPMQYRNRDLSTNI